MEHNPITLLSGMPDPESVRALEAHLIGQPQINLHTQHVVHGGMCCRHGFIPAGTLLTGALTNCDNICVVMGDITVTTDDGVQRLTGVHVLAAKAGAKRAGVAHADTFWATIHRTDLTDVQAIEDEMTSESASLQTRRAGIVYQQPVSLEA